MNTIERESGENFAGTLARVLPKAEILHTQATSTEQSAITHLVFPKTMEHKAVDNESLLEHPRRASGVARFADVDSFIRYTNDFARPGTTVWCKFDPQTYALSFTAVIDEHVSGAAGWRGHKAVYVPAQSVEWIRWTSKNGKDRGTMSQADFAEFLEDNELDIQNVEGFPTSQQMKGMATEFSLKQDVAIKSIVRSASGGVQLNYINDADAETLAAMKIFERFAIGVPVFWTKPEASESPEETLKAYRIDARLKWRQSGSKVSFWYELIRPDRVHQKAAVDLIEALRVRLVNVQLLMGEMP